MKMLHRLTFALFALTIAPQIAVSAASDDFVVKDYATMQMPAPGMEPESTFRKADREQQSDQALGTAGIDIPDATLEGRKLTVSQTEGGSDTRTEIVTPPAAPGKIPKVRSDCQRCLKKHNGKWLNYNFEGYQIRECVKTSRHVRWYEKNNIPLLTSCNGLSTDETLEFKPELPSSWPKTCDECLKKNRAVGQKTTKEKPKLVWVTYYGYREFCFPAQLVEKLDFLPLSKEVFDSGCEEVPITQLITQLPKIHPFERTYLWGCMHADKSDWCVIPERGKHTKFCTKRRWTNTKEKNPYCPGGTAYSVPSAVPKEVQTRHVESLTDTCTKCLALNARYCIHYKEHRKLKMCVSREQQAALCLGRVIDNCATISSADQIASMGNPELAIDDDERRLLENPETVDESDDDE